MLEQGRVRVNDETQKAASRTLHAGDVLEVGSRSGVRKLVRGIEILFEDDELLVIHKPAGLLTVATPHEKEHTAYAYLREYVKERNPHRKLFIVHRLDRFVSGLLVFAKSQAVKEQLQALFMKHDISRKYWALVEGRVKKDQGTIRSLLAQDRAQRMRSTKDATTGKHAVTHFRVLRRFSNLSALEVTLETGRKNQIRVHLSEMGHPIVGDRAYGSTMDPVGRIGLHAYLLGFRHPRSGSRLLFQTEPPAEFRRYLPQSAD